MKEAFTLIELIVVIVIIAILASLGMYSYKPHNLQNDSNYIYLKILEAKYQGLNFDKYGLANSSSIGCIDLRKSAIKNMAKKDRYAFKSQIENFIDTLCFDSFGRAHIDDNRTLLASLAHQKRLFLRLVYHNRQALFFILPQSGYSIIKYEKKVER